MTATERPPPCAATTSPLPPSIEGVLPAPRLTHGDAADLLCTLLIRLARVRGKPAESFVLAALAKIDRAAWMFDDLTPKQLARATRGVKAALAAHRPAQDA